MRRVVRQSLTNGLILFSLFSVNNTALALPQEGYTPPTAGVTVADPQYRLLTSLKFDKSDTQAINQQPASEQLEPNLFELQGDRIRITYSTSSFAGVPQLSYSARGQNRTFSGEEIQVEETGLGTIVTVLLQNGAADEPIESLTLLLPVVQLSQKLRKLPIQTKAILSRRSVFVNRTIPAQLQTYDTINLYGTAQQVEF